MRVQRTSDSAESPLRHGGKAEPALPSPSADSTADPAVTAPLAAPVAPAPNGTAAASASPIAPANDRRGATDGFEMLGIEPPKSRAAWLGLGGLLLLSVAIFLAFQWIGVDRIRGAVEDAGPWGPVVFVALKVSTFVIAPLSSAPLRMSAGAVFGYWEGVALTILGNAIGGSANFWISRLIGRRLVAKFVGGSGMATVDRLVGRLADWRALAFARVFLAALWDVVSYAAGFTRIRYPVYLAVAVIGDIPSTMLFVGVGTSLVEDPKMLLGVLVGFALLYGLLPMAQRLIGGGAPAAKDAPSDSRA